MWNPDDELRQRNRRLKAWLSRQRRWVRTTFPPGVRSLVGLALIGGGFLGFLPILGFWMVPLGVIFVGLDVGSIRRAVGRIFGRTPRLRHKSNRDKVNKNKD